MCGQYKRGVAVVIVALVVTIGSFATTVYLDARSCVSEVEHTRRRGRTDMKETLQASNERLQQQVDELSAMVDLLHRAVGALQATAPRDQVRSMPDPWAPGAVETRLTARDLHPSAAPTDASRRHLLKLAGGAAVGDVA